MKAMSYSITVQGLRRISLRLGILRNGRKNIGIMHDINLPENMERLCIKN